MKPTIDLVYYYCSFANTQSLEESTILGSLLIQLFQNPQLAVTSLEPIYRTSESQIRGSAQPKQLSTKDLLNLITARISQLEEVYMLIDGINESVDPESILESLKQIIHSCASTVVHLFISSIDEKGIAPFLDSFPNLRAEALRHDDLRSDFGILVQESLDPNSRLRRYDSDLIAEIQWRLTQGALGM